MTDYFALLNQPRQPWLDSDELKQAFHAKSMQSHPDVAAATDDAFAQLNEAYQVLLDPKRRIQHLLGLEQREPPRDRSVPADIADLFPVVAETTHAADALAQKMEAATNPLSRSLLKPQILAVQSRLADTLQRLGQLRGSADAELLRLNGAVPLAEAEWAQLHDLFLRFSYLTRWIAELEEKQLRLAHT